MKQGSDEHLPGLFRFAIIVPVVRSLFIACSGELQLQSHLIVRQSDFRRERVEAFWITAGHSLALGKSINYQLE
jgi:hypothetical protein